MKGAQRRIMLDHLVSILTTGMDDKVEAVAALYPTETLPNIAAVYLNEDDYNKVKLFPCLLVFSFGPPVLSEMTGSVLYEYPVDIVSFDIPRTDGLPALYNRIYAYQGCLTDLLLADHGYEEGYWQDVHPKEPVDPQFVEERFGSLGRGEGYRFGFQTCVDY